MAEGGRGMLGGNSGKHVERAQRVPIGEHSTLSMRMPPLDWSPILNLFLS